jgi:plasmid stabilization system protein ParE
MNDFELEYTLGAQAEIEDAYRWIKERSPQGAAKWREDLIEKMEALSRTPHIHPIAPESERFSKAIRLLLFRKRRSQFRVYFTTETKRVVILSVRRSSRKPLEEGDLEP